MTRYPRLIAPHGYEAHPRHAVVLAKLQSPDGARAFVDVLLLPADVASVIVEHGGYSHKVANRATADGLRLLFLSDKPGVLKSHGRGVSLTAQLEVCEGGIILPGLPPLLPFEAGEAEAYPFAFLAGIDAAIRSLPRWGDWARSEGIDTPRLHRYVHDKQALAGGVVGLA